MSSHFGSTVAASHPLQLFDSAVEAAGTTASKGTPREKCSISATPAWDNIGNTMSFVHTQNDRIQAQPRTNEQTQVNFALETLMQV